MPEASCAALEAEALVRQFWQLANARQWAAMGRLLAPSLRYEVPQTRECIDSAEGFVDFFATWPQPWAVRIERCVSDGEQVALQMVFDDGKALQTAVGFYALDKGRIAQITEFWPEPYEPPARQTQHMQRY